MANAANNHALQFNLESACFLNGGTPPGKLRFDAGGRVIAGHTVAAKTIDLDDTLVFPGLVNSHDHLEFNLYPALGNPPYSDTDEWAEDIHRHNTAIIRSVESIRPELRRLWGALKNLCCGVTAVMDHGEDGANVRDALPLRAVRPFRFLYRADTRWAWLRAMTTRGDGPLVFHVAEGTGKEAARRSARFLRRATGRGPLVGVHGIGLDAGAARSLAALVWCPVSNQFLFHRTADVAALKNATKILFGTDSSISADGTIWDHLRTAREHGGLSDSELLDSVTTTARQVWGLGNGGDTVIARRRHEDPRESFFMTTAADIHAVVSRQRLAVMSEDLYQQIVQKTAPEPWCEQYSAVRIGGRQLRIYCPTPALLSELATIENAPLSLPRSS